MSQTNIFHTHPDLQLFAEGGSGTVGGTGADGATGVSAGVSGSQKSKAESGKNPLANVIYGKQGGKVPESDRFADGQNTGAEAETGTASEAQRIAEFEKLIKGEYKDLYDARMQDTVQKRLKSTKEIVDKYNKLSPVLDIFAQKYGCDDAGDIDALVKAIEEDDSYYVDEALDRGITVEQLRKVKKIERENAELKRQIDSRKAEDEASKIYSTWVDQAEKAKLKYPSLDLAAEISNPQFASLLKCGIDVESAYTVIHKDEIIPAAMQYTAQTVARKITDGIIANGARPVENGVSQQAAAVIKSDVSQLSRLDHAEINRRVARGEKISF